ncbi:MAG: hypothetical protein RIQ82_1229 [Bacteroidota bacterium]
MLVRWQKQWFVLVFINLLISLPAWSEVFETVPLEVNNPGGLQGKLVRRESSDLVVLLHGCTQTAEELARATGMLASSHSFSLLLPQQMPENNAKLCFNWFSPQDQAGTDGEAQSIISMIEWVKSTQDIKRVYLLGLSAGGAMASNLLSNMPEYFTAGIIVAGVAYPCAKDLLMAMTCMKSGGEDTADELAVKLGHLRGAQLPKLIIISGQADQIVNPTNAVKQANIWAKLGGYKHISKQERPGYSLDSWGESVSSSAIFHFSIEGFGHAWPQDSELRSEMNDDPFILSAPIDVMMLLAELRGDPYGTNGQHHFIKQ